jgi:hypothetical protein
MAARPESLCVNYSGAAGDGSAGNYLEFGMTDLRQAAQQALEALEICEQDGYIPVRLTRDSITDLKAALEQLVVEPENGNIRDAFERYWVTTRGDKKAARELQRHPLQPQTYVQDSANRHWVTWQSAQQALEQPKWSEFLHYPKCWDTAAYPTLKSAIHETLAWSGCSQCQPAAQPAQQPVACQYAVDVAMPEYRCVGKCQYTTPFAAQRKKEHITNGDPCWCNPEIDYVDPETGVAVIVHKEPQ